MSIIQLKKFPALQGNIIKMFTLHRMAGTEFVYDNKIILKINRNYRAGYMGGPFYLVGVMEHFSNSLKWCHVN